MEQIPLPPQALAEPQIKVSGPHTRLEWGLLLRDFYRSTKAYGFWLYSAWLEVLLNYRSTVLGPLWIVVGTGVFVFTVGTLYNRVVLAGGSNVYLAHLAIGITLWFLLIQSVVKSCEVFLDNRAVLLDGAITYTDLLLKLLTTNIIYFMHNFVIVVLVFIVLGIMPTFSALIVLLTAPLVLGNILWMCVDRIDPRNALRRSRRTASLDASLGVLRHADPLDSASACARTVCRGPALPESVLLPHRGDTRAADLRDHSLV